MKNPNVIQAIIALVVITGIGGLAYKLGKSWFDKYEAAKALRDAEKAGKPVNNTPGTAGYNPNIPSLNDDQIKLIAQQINDSVGYVWNSTDIMKAAFAELNNNADLQALIARFGMAMKNTHGINASRVTLPDFMAKFYSGDVADVNSAMKAKGITNTI